MRILPLDTRDSEAVALKFDPPAGDAVDEEAGVDRWKRDRDLLLDIVDSKPFERPAGNANVGMRIDPLGIDEVAQPVVVGDVVALGDGLVGRRAQRRRDAPDGIELELAVGFEITAEIVPVAGRRRATAL